MARRKGVADPEDHVAINVALYGPGGAWAMTERGRAALRRDATTLAIGASAFSFTGDRLVLHLDEIAAPLPRRINGTVAIEMDFLNDRVFTLDRAGRHLWRPIAPVARIDVRLDRPNLSWRGSAYVDHNRGCEPLEDGFRSWTWTRSTHGEGADIAYTVRQRHGPGESESAETIPAEGFAAAFDRQGGLALREAPAAVRLPRTRWGVDREAASEDAEARVDRTLEDTPFYARSVVTTRLFGRTSAGMHESLSLDRFRSPIVQMMLPFRMPRRGRSGPVPR